MGIGTVDRVFAEFEKISVETIKYRSPISTHFADLNKMGLETQEDLDELVVVTDNDYLVQVNR
jgi:hypothetical protein